MFSKLFSDSCIPCARSSMTVDDSNFFGKVEQSRGGFIRLDYQVQATLSNIHFDMPCYIKDRLNSYQAHHYSNLGQVFALALAFKPGTEINLHANTFKTTLGEAVEAFSPEVQLIVDSNENQVWIANLDTLGELLDHLAKPETRCGIFTRTNAAYGRMVFGHDNIVPPHTVRAP